MKSMIGFTRGLMSMPMPWPLWIGLLVVVNIAGPIYFFEAFEAKVVLAAFLAGAAFMTAIFAAKGFVRLLGIGHILWIPMVPWLWTRLDQVGPGDLLGYWMIAVLAVNGIALIIDAIDVLRYVGGDRKPYVGLATAAGSDAMNSARFQVDSGLFPFESRTVKLKSGATIHYIDEGQGPPLLLLHGNPTWSFLYRNIIPGLKDRFRCIAPDYPGFGFSIAAAGYGFTAAEHANVMAEFVEALDLRDFTIMMQDWGGPIGFSIALRHPDWVRGFIIGNTFAWPLERFGQKMFSRIMGGPIGRTLAWCCNGIVLFFMSRGVATGLDKRALKMYLAPFKKRGNRAPTHIFPRQLRAAGPFLAEISRELPTVADKPALVVWGGKDFAFQAPERSRFEQLFPNHKTVLLPNAGHFIQEDAPDDIVQAVRSWFAADKGKSRAQ